MKVYQLIDFLKDMPQNADCIYSGDDEGNYYYDVFYAPTKGTFENGDFEEIKEGDDPPKLTYHKKLVVCIN